MKAKESSSLFSADETATPFGCHIKFHGQEWEVGRLIFGDKDSLIFPGKKELVAFWYDENHHYEEEEYTMLGEEIRDPIFEYV